MRLPRDNGGSSCGWAGELDLHGLHGMREEQAQANGARLQPAHLTTAVPAPSAAVPQRDLVPGQIPQLRAQVLTVPLHHKDVVAFGHGDLVGVAALSVHRVGGDDDAMQIQTGRQRGERRDLVALRLDLGAVQDGGQRVVSAAREPRTVVPSTAGPASTIWSSSTGSAMWRASQDPMTSSAASPSRHDITRPSMEAFGVVSCRPRLSRRWGRCRQRSVQSGPGSMLRGAPRPGTARAGSPAGGDGPVHGTDWGWCALQVDQHGQLSRFGEGRRQDGVLAMTGEGTNRGGWCADSAPDRDLWPQQP